MLYQRYGYSQWDGTQQILGRPDIDASELMVALSDDLLQQGDVMRALRQELFRNGMQNRDGSEMPNLRQPFE